ncbi:hypothetical protein KC19_3G018900 [Ceratodon purpureus]|uniref:Trichome birefringence-like N-terminal domain-containing protein n=1 Tax=Ceratodon purpureus TaxID=3225 RepID=A0A8T0IFX5_CERPU|nr:hypothetical protein KC19_3G018900 [Ceratodon purpureus]
METYHVHGRRGKESTVCGINRANQTLFLMMAMVATMVCVLLWEASPFTSAGVVHSPVLKSVPRSELEEQSRLYESRPFLKNPLLEKKPSEDNVALLDLADETNVSQEEAGMILDTTLPGSKPSTTRENEPTATDAVPESIQRSSNETLAESEEMSLAETEIVLAERASHDADTTEVPPNSDDLFLEVDLDARPSAKPLGAPSSEEDTFSTSMAVNQTSTLEEVEADAIAQETEFEEKNSSGKCDYSVGKWVLDETRPLYSGLECNMWLAPGFSCRLNNHPDKLLDRYRWQPAGCDLPEFNASAVLELMRNKVLAFVGDSLARQQLQSLLCMLTRGKNDTVVTDRGSDFGFFTPPGDRKPNGFAYRFEATNTTIIFKWTVTLAHVQPLNTSNPLTRNALHLDRPEQFLEDHLRELDVVVLNSGHHWNGGKMKMNRYDFYLHGKPVNKSSELSRVPVAYNTTVHNIVHWMSKAIEGTDKVVYYRSLSPRHFRNGDWNTGGTCDTIRFEEGKQVQEGNRVDPNAESAIVGTNVNLLNITSLSLDRGETHVSKYGGGTGGQDCLHWCLPGIPDTWNEILFAELATKFKGRSSATSE